MIQSLPKFEEREWQSVGLIQKIKYGTYKKIA